MRTVLLLLLITTTITPLQRLTRINLRTPLQPRLLKIPPIQQLCWSLPQFTTVLLSRMMRKQLTVIPTMHTPLMARQKCTMPTT